MASLLFGGLAGAAEVLQKDIRVSYLPLRYIFDGTQKAPPADQQGFTFNGRTYVPLRFMAESMGKAVQYDPADFSIYVGRRPATPPAFWDGFALQGKGAVKTEYFPTGALNVDGQEMLNSMLVTSLAIPPATPPVVDDVTYFVKDFVLDGKYSSLTGTLYVPQHITVI